MRLYALRSFTIFISLIFSLSCWTKVFVVSDIDDTIKKANSADGGVRQAYHFFRKKIYPEMRDMFNELDETYERFGEEVEFHYVSAAPDFLFNQEKWLKEHNFPAGEATLKRKGDGDTYTYKTNVIGAILKKARPTDTIYLFGDNASKDAIVYKELVEKLGLQNNFIYIRDVTTYATEWNDELVVRKLDGISYFFSEVEFIGDSGLFFMSEKLKDDIKSAYASKDLIPDYTLKSLEKRLSKDWGCRLNNSCRCIAKEEAQRFWTDYHRQY